MTKKEQLFYLLEAYQKNEYDIPTFCNVFEEIFYPDIPRDELTPHELKVFEALGEKIVRFSPFDEDLKKYPKTYFSDSAINEAIMESYKELNRN